jgi:hypothetical protein
VFVANFVRDLSARGPVLLDCGRHPTWWLFAWNAVAFAVLGLSANGWSGFAGAFAPAVPAFLVAFVAFWVVLATGRLQVCERGLWQYWGLLRWEKVATYRWADDGTLILRGRGFGQFLQGALPVPPERRAEFKALLGKHTAVEGLV